MKLVSWLEDIDIESENYGKESKFTAQLLQANFPLVSGFVITKDAYFDFLKQNNLEYKIRQLLSTISIDLSDSLMQGEFHIKNLFAGASLTDAFVEALFLMSSEMGPQVSLELYETGKNGKKHKRISAVETNKLAEQMIQVWADMFTSGALWKRHQLGLDHFENGAEIIVREQIHGDKTGIITTIEPDTHEKDKIVITTSYPHDHDHYVLSKKNLTIIDRHLTYSTNVQKLTSEEIAALGEMAKKIEEHLYFPQEISWGFSGPNLYITDIKPVTSMAKQKVGRANKLPLARGKGITSLITTGRIHIIPSGTKQNINSHDIVILSHLPADNVKFYKKARGIIIESAVLPAATVTLLKHYGIPSVNNVRNAATKFRNGSIVTIHSANGEIYGGGFV